MRPCLLHVYPLNGTVSLACRALLPCTVRHLPTCTCRYVPVALQRHHICAVPFSVFPAPSHPSFPHPTELSSCSQYIKLVVGIIQSPRAQGKTSHALFVTELHRALGRLPAGGPPSVPAWVRAVCRVQCGPLSCLIRWAIRPVLTVCAQRSPRMHGTPLPTQLHR